MSDFFTLPQRTKNHLFIFGPQVGVAAKGYESWTKPKWASMVSIVAVSSGAGGGGGFSRASTADGGGGGGGACSGLTRFICPAICLPDVLYVQVHGGGAGGTANNNGVQGEITYVLTGKTAVAPNILVQGTASVPGPGVAGSGTSAGAGGTIPSNPAIQPMNYWGHWMTVQGLAGGAGGAHTGAVGSTITAWGSIPLSPGAGGGGSTGSDNAGGAQTPTAAIDLGSQMYFASGAGTIAAAGLANGGDGQAGMSRVTPFLNSGGSGGGSNDDGQGGAGGAGGIGCGGGGGGAGVTGGRGGNGGPGIVIITCW